MIKKDEMMKYSKNFENENEAMLYAECKDGTTELIMSGGGIPIFYIIRCVLARLAELRGSTIDDALGMLEYVIEETKKEEERVKKESA